MEQFDIQIVVANKGFVYVGRVEYKNQWEINNIFTVVIHNARCIRRWGTSRGLAEIANDGPTKTTILDCRCTVRLHPLSIVNTIDCDQAKWSAHI